MVSDQIFDQMTSEFTGEKIPWISNIKELGSDIHPGVNYPEASVGERYITAPASTKKGLILSIDKETIFFDRTGQLLRQAAKVGEKVGYWKEEKCLRTFLGIDNTYSLNGSTTNTYLTGGSYINKQGSTPLVDYTSINTNFVLFSNMTDPDTYLPIQVEMKDLFVMPAGLFTAKRIVGATETRNIYPGFAASSPAAPGNVEMLAPSPVPPLSVITSSLAKNVLVNQGSVLSSNADLYWWTGDFKKAFLYITNWPISVIQAPPNNIREFENDIVLRFKASEMGTPVVVDPRYVIMNTN
jgi:hypothetical protein